MPRSSPPVLVIADSVRIWGGAQRFVLDAARGLGARGWQVHIVAYPDSPLHARASEAGHSVRPTRTRANGAPWTVLPLAAWMRRVRADFLLTTYDKDLRTAGLASLLSGRKMGRVHSRECDAPIKDRPHIRWFHSRLAHRIWVNSEATRRTSLESAPWLDPERVDIVEKGIELDPFTRLDRSRREAGPCRIGFAGQLVPRKQLDLLLEAVAQLEAGSFELRVAGEGPAESAWRERADALGLSPRVQWCGFVEDMPRFLADIDVFVQPSAEEGWGYVLAEACAAGCAVIALDRSSSAEVLGHGEGGRLVRNTSAEALAAALRDFQRMGEKGRGEWGRRARQWAQDQLGLDSMLDRLEYGLHRVDPRPHREASPRNPG